MDSDSFLTATGVRAQDVRLRLLKSSFPHSARSQMPEKSEPDDLSRMKPRRQRAIERLAISLTPGSEEWHVAPRRQCDGHEPGMRVWKK